jgi:hypothetical protein
MRWAVLLFLLGALVAARPAHADDNEPYTVRAGDTCLGIVHQRYGSANGLRAFHDLNPQLGPLPHTLRAGQVVLVPRRGPAPPEARIDAAERQVQSRGPDAADWQAARVGQDLYRAWRVNTLDRSAATIGFGDATRLYLREQTLVIIYGRTSTSAAVSSTRATLERGTLRGRLAELAGEGEARLEVATPSSDATLGAGNAVVAVDEGGKSAVSNLDGRDATVKGKTGAPVKVKKAMGTTVATGAPPAPPRPLPPTPVWRVPPPAVVAGPEGRGGTLRGAWRPVAEAARYHIEVAPDDGSRVVAAVDVPARVTELEVHAVPAGSWRVTVAAIDADGLESPPSSRLAVKVVAVGLVAPGGTRLALAPLADPSAAPPAPRVLVGTALEAPAGLTCERPVFITPGPAVVACRTAEGVAVGGFPVEVVAAEARPTAPLEVTQGSSARVDLVVASVVELPAALTLESATPGVRVEAAEAGAASAASTAAGASSTAPAERHLVATVTADRTAPARARLWVVAAGGSRLAPVELTVNAAPVVPVVEPSQPELLAAPPAPLLLGLRAADRPGAWFWAAVGASRGPSGGDVSTVNGRLGVGAAVRPGDGDWVFRGAGSFDFGAPGTRAAVNAGVGRRLLAFADGGLDLELAGWVPLTSAAASAVAQPGLDVWVRPLAPLTLRARTGAVLGDGTTLSSSAAGAWVAPWPWLSAGLEVDVAVGQAGGDSSRAAAALRAALGVQTARFSASVAVRLAASDDALTLWDASGFVVALGARL